MSSGSPVHVLHDDADSDAAEIARHEARFEPRTGIPLELPRCGMQLPEWRRTGMLADPHATRRGGSGARP
jgi:hypothetical protein